MERIRNEGDQQPGRRFYHRRVAACGAAEQMGLFAPVKSKALESALPPNRHPDGNWFGFSTPRSHHRLQQRHDEAGRNREL